MDYAALRDRMVNEQLARRGISQRRVLDAFGSVKRHEFLPAGLKAHAYEDHPLPIGEGQTISQPYMVALMTELLELKGGEKVLEVGAGSGYQAAILSRLAEEVYTVERIAAIAARAKETLERLGITNVTLGVRDGTLGWPEHAPYDRVIVTAAAPRVPEALVGQLAVGGKLVIPVGSMFGQVLTVVDKTDSGIATRQAGGCVFVPLLGKDGWQESEL